MALDPGDWAYHLVLTIDNTKIGSALSNFPVPIKLSGSCGQSSFDATAVFDELGANSKKIAVTTDDYNECYVEIEKWDDTAEEAYLHVKVGTIVSGADTVLYLFYDSSNADNDDFVGTLQSVPAMAVWDSDFAAVWHLVGDPSTAANIKDSTGVNDGVTTLLEADDEVDGLFGGGLDFDDEDLRFGNDASLQLTAELTLEAVFMRDTTHASVVGIASKYIGFGSNDRAYVIGMDTAEKFNFVLSRDGDTSPLTNLTGSTVMGDGVWYYGVGKYKGSNTTAELRLNDTEEDSTGAAVASVFNTAAVFSIGNQYRRTADYMWGGQMCEVRLSKIKRTDDWCDATYYGLFDNLITLAEPEPPSGNPWWYYQMMRRQ